MVYQNGVSVRIRNDVNGVLVPEYDTEPGRNKVAIEAVHGATLCPEITIHEDFEWHGANGINVTVRYGTPSLQITLWAPDPYKGKDTDERKDWTIQIPGTQSWDPSRGQIIDLEYRFLNEQVRSDSQLFLLNEDSLR